MEAGGQKNIVDKEIVLTVYSANAPDLTVIDLPGITRNPVGDQPKNIERRLRDYQETGRLVERWWKPKA